MQHLIDDEKQEAGQMDKNTEINVTLELIKQDINELRQTIEDCKQVPKTCQVNMESPTIKDVFEVEKKVHELVIANLNKISGLDKEERQALLRETSLLIDILEIYRHKKVNLEIMQHFQYPTKPIA